MNYKLTNTYERMIVHMISVFHHKNYTINEYKCIRKNYLCVSYNMSSDMDV